MVGVVDSLYVGDLDPGVSEADLLDAFAKFGPTSVRVCRDSKSGVSLRYGYANFGSKFYAMNAMKALNHSLLHGQPIRIMLPQKDHHHNSGSANLYVKGLDESVGAMELENIFGKYGVVVSCKVAMENGRSKGFGFVQLDSEEAAQAAIRSLHGSVISGNKKLYVAKFVKKSERKASPQEPNRSNLYIKNLDPDITDDLLKEKFSAFGKVTSAIVMKEELQKSRGFGFVCFESQEQAKKAMEVMNGVQFGSNIVYVGEAMKKAERQELLKRQFTNSTVYVKNLDSSVDEKALREFFAGCGEIHSAKVMHNTNSLSMGFGFVVFSSPEDANKAVASFHGTMFCKRRLHVSIAQRKQDRCNAFQPQFAKPPLAVSNNLPSKYCSPCYGLLPQYPTSFDSPHPIFMEWCYGIRRQNPKQMRCASFSGANQILAEGLDPHQFIVPFSPQSKHSVQAVKDTYQMQQYPTSFDSPHPTFMDWRYGVRLQNPKQMRYASFSGVNQILAEGLDSYQFIVPYSPQSQHSVQAVKDTYQMQQPVRMEHYGCAGSPKNNYFKLWTRGDSSALVVNNKSQKALTGFYEGANPESQKQMSRDILTS